METQAPALSPEYTRLVEDCDKLSADIRAIHKGTLDLLARVQDFNMRAEAEIARARRAA